MNGIIYKVIKKLKKIKTRHREVCIANTHINVNSYGLNINALPNIKIKDVN